MRESEDYGIEFLGTAAELFSGVIQASQGNLNKGLRTVEYAAKVLIESDSLYRYGNAEYSLGKVYARIALGESEKNFSLIAKNIGFLMKNVPLADKKAEAYYGKAIEVARKIGAKGLLGQACLDLGRLYRGKKKHPQAAECLAMAIEAFTTCNATVYLKQAQEALASLKPISTPEGEPQSI